MKVLDLFAGKGGFSSGFVGPEVTMETLDNGRDGKFVVTHTMDIADFHAPQGAFDVVLSGTPCTEYAKWMMRGCLFADRSKVEYPDNELLLHTLRIINEVQPRVYIVENVVGARQFISLYLGQPAIRIGKRYFWSNLHIDPSEINHAWYERKTLRTVRVIDKHGKMSCAGRGMRGSAKDRSCIERPISEFFYKKCVQEMKKERYDFVPIAIRETEPRCESCNEFLHRKNWRLFRVPPDIKRKNDVCIECSQKQKE